MEKQENNHSVIIGYLGELCQETGQYQCENHHTTYVRVEKGNPFPAVKKTLTSRTLRPGSLLSVTSSISSSYGTTAPQNQSLWQPKESVRANVHPQCAEV